MAELLIDSVEPLARKPPSPSNAAKLAPWQVKLAQERMLLHIRGGLRIAEIATRLDLSETHFAKAFSNTVGVAPYRWFQNARIACAVRLLRDSSASLADIAASCGYSHQSHFITSFSNAMGATPGRWRRRQRKTRPHMM